MNIFVGKTPVLFFGVVEDRNDPLKANRVRVRIFYWNTADKATLPITALKWAHVVLPTTEAGISGIGKSPHGLVEGSWVTGFFIDGEQGQYPIIMGSLPGIPTELVDSTKGFNDPKGQYPRYIDEPDINRLARNENETLSATKNAGRSIGISTANSSETWDEPASTYAAQYPYNKVTETESGHVFEVDDTTGAERLHRYHRTGTFEEIDPTGNRVTRIVGSDYEIVATDKNIYVKGKCNLTVDGNVTTKINGNWNIEVSGNKTEVIKGSHTQTITGKSVATWSGEESNIICNNGSSNIGLITHTHTDPAGIVGSQTSTAND